MILCFILMQISEFIYFKMYYTRILQLFNGKLLTLKKGENLPLKIIY